MRHALAVLLLAVPLFGCSESPQPLEPIELRSSATDNTVSLGSVCAGGGIARNNALLGPTSCKIERDNSVQHANVNQRKRPGMFEQKKSRTVIVAPGSEVFVTYDLGQSHGCCDDHFVGALQIRVDGVVKVDTTVLFFDYSTVSSFLECYDFFFPTEVVKGQTRPSPVPKFADICEKDVPPLRNYIKVEQVSLGVFFEEGKEHIVELWLGDAGWNEIFEMSVSPSSPLINAGAFVQNTPTPWASKLPFTAGEWTLNRNPLDPALPALGITITGRGTINHTTPVGFESKYLFFGSNNHLLILDISSTERMVRLVNFGSLSETSILDRTAIPSTVQVPSVQYSQGSGDAFLFFTPKGDGTVVGLAIRRGDNGGLLCSGPAPYSPGGRIAGEATATDTLQIKDGSTVIKKCRKPTPCLPGALAFRSPGNGERFMARRHT